MTNLERHYAINETLTKKVAEFIEKGYIINYKTMNGLQNCEMARVDLIKGYKFVRIFVTQTFIRDKNRYFVKVGEADINSIDTVCDLSTVWTHEMRIIEEIEIKGGKN